MKIALIVIALILLIFAVLLFVPFFFVIEFSKKEDKKNFDVKVKYLFFNIKTKDRKNEKPDETVKEKADLGEKIKQGIETFKKMEDDVVDILHYASEKAVKIREIRFLLDFGVSDPMNTGILTGAINGIVYNILAVLNNYFEVEVCDVKINPDFERKHMDISSRCILKIKSVHIIIIVFKVLKMYFKITKTKKGSF